MELVYEVFLHAASKDRAVSAKLCLVCRTTHSWMLPALYSTVVLTSSSEIVCFSNSLSRSSSRCLPETGTSGITPASHVRHLWLGPTSSSAEHDLSYASSAWPVTLIYRILAHCRELRALALINFAQHLVYRIEAMISPTVEMVHLGPVHGHLDFRKLACAARLRTISSLDTYLSDWDVQDLVLAPHIRRIRRFYTGSIGQRIGFAFEQLPCVKKSTSLEEMQIIVCGETTEGARQELAMMAEEFMDNADARVELIAMARRPDGQMDGIGAFHDDWLAELGLCLRRTQIRWKMAE